jgi:hypothetical protein
MGLRFCLGAALWTWLACTHLAIEMLLQQCNLFRDQAGRMLGEGDEEAGEGARTTRILGRKGFGGNLAVLGHQATHMFEAPRTEAPRRPVQDTPAA